MTNLNERQEKLMEHVNHSMSSMKQERELLKQEVPAMIKGELAKLRPTPHQQTPDQVHHAAFLQAQWDEDDQLNTSNENKIQEEKEVTNMSVGEGKSELNQILNQGQE